MISALRCHKNVACSVPPAVMCVGSASKITTTVTSMQHRAMVHTAYSRSKVDGANEIQTRCWLVVVDIVVEV